MDEREKMEEQERTKAVNKSGEQMFDAFTTAMAAACMVVFALVAIAARVVTGVWAVMEYWQWLNR